MKLREYIIEGGSDKLARWGYTFGKNHGIMPDKKGFHELCVEHMEGKVGDANGYCARVKDAYFGSTYWRGKGKTTKETKASVKAHPNYEKGKRKPATTKEKEK